MTKKTDRNVYLSFGGSLIRGIQWGALALTLVGTALLLLVGCMSTGEHGTLFGCRCFIVLSETMGSAMETGDLAIIRQTEVNEIECNDVIACYMADGSDAYLIHRVVEICEDYEGTGVTCFYTRGDTVNARDPLVDESRVIGVVTLVIPKLGYILRFLQMRWYYAVAFVLLFFLCLRLFQVYLDGKAFVLAEGDKQEGNASADESYCLFRKKKSGTRFEICRQKHESVRRWYLNGNFIFQVHGYEVVHVFAVLLLVGILFGGVFTYFLVRNEVAEELVQTDGNGLVLSEDYALTQADTIKTTLSGKVSNTGNREAVVRVTLTAASGYVFDYSEMKGKMSDDHETESSIFVTAASDSAEYAPGDILFQILLGSVALSDDEDYADDFREYDWLFDVENSDETCAYFYYGKVLGSGRTTKKLVDYVVSGNGTQTAVSEGDFFDLTLDASLNGATLASREKYVNGINKNLRGLSWNMEAKKTGTNDSNYCCIYWGSVEERYGSFG